MIALKFPIETGENMPLFCRLIYICFLTRKKIDTDMFMSAHIMIHTQMNW